MAKTMTPKTPVDGAYASAGGPAGEMANIDNEAVDRLKTELRDAFAAPDSAYSRLVADEVIQRNQRSKASRR